jgi:hypothetical protein
VEFAPRLMPWQHKMVGAKRAEMSARAPLD